MLIDFIYFFINYTCKTFSTSIFCASLPTASQGSTHWWLGLFFGVSVSSLLFGRQAEASRSSNRSSTSAQWYSSHLCGKVKGNQLYFYLYVTNAITGNYSIIKSIYMYSRLSLIGTLLIGTIGLSEPIFKSHYRIYTMLLLLIGTHGLSEPK